MNTDHASTSLSTGLGNVITTISDRKKRIAGENPAFEAVIETAQDYYPFGMLMPGRKYNPAEYRFGFNGQEKDDEITGVTGSHLDFGARIYDSRLGRWLNPDPLFKKYPSWSSYNFAMNNPVMFIDPNGNEVYIHGADAKKAVTALQTKTSLELSYDVKTGMLTAVGKPESKLDRELLGAIDDKGIRVNLHTTRENSYISKDGSKQLFIIGAYDGSTVETEYQREVDGVLLDGPGMMNDGSGVTKKVFETTQYINMEHSKKAEAAGVSNQGSDVFHEVIESYYGGQNDPGGTYDADKWTESHNKAHDVDPSAPRVNHDSG